MRLPFLSSLALLAFGAVLATPLKEDSTTSVGVVETVSCEGSHFIVSVQRTDDVREDTGELIAEKVSNIVFDFKVDRDAEALLINGYALKLIPQRIQKLTLLAAVLPRDHPALPQTPEIGSVKTPKVIDALSKLERNGLIAADVDLHISYEGETRHIEIHIQVVEVEGEQVIHKDLLAARIILPKHHHSPKVSHEGADYPHKKVEGPSCASSDLLCRLSSWLKSLYPSCGRMKGNRPNPHHHHHHHHHHHDGSDRTPEFKGQHHHLGHRHRFHHRHGFMRFVMNVVIPILIGAAAGVTIGILSVFIAEIVGGIILRIRGRRNAEYIAVDVKEDEIEDEELPVYEELEGTPTYTEEKK